MSTSGLEVIRYVGDNNVIVAKSSIEDFNTKSQLIVNESQEALFYKNGQALDLFGSGAHSLKTDNLPLFKKFFLNLFNKNYPLPCEIYFINKVNVMDIVWGTDSPIPIIEPKFKLPIHVRANGQMGIKVIDSRKFVVKVVGQLPKFTIDDVKKTIKGMLMPNVKDYIAKVIFEQNVGVYEITSKILDISKEIQKKLNNYLEDLGLEAVHFYVNSINAPDDDLAKISEVQEKKLQAETDMDIEARREVLLAEAKAKARALQGYTYQDERKFDVLEGAAKNEGAGATMGPAMGVGMGFGMGNAFGSNMPNMNNMGSGNQNVSSGTKICPNCQAQNSSSSKFCCECGFKFEQSKFCPECGNKITGNPKFCPECGQKLS